MKTMKTTVSPEGEAVLRRVRGREEVLGVVHPGERLRIGRHPSNDVVLDHPTVSRFHARIDWPRGLGRPLLADLESQNGTALDGRAVRHAVEARILSGALLRFGGELSRLELAAGPALLRETAEQQVELVFEAGPEMSGLFENDCHARALVETLELNRRTGSLTLCFPEREATLVFAQGRIMHATHGKDEGLPAARAILYRLEGIEPRRVAYAFRLAFEVGLNAHPLRTWASDLLRARRAAGGSRPTRPMKRLASALRRRRPPPPLRRRPSTVVLPSPGAAVG